MKDRTKNFRNFDNLIDEHLCDPELLLLLLNDAIAHEDTDDVQKCFRSIVHDHGGISRFAWKSGIDPKDLNNILNSSEKDLKTLLKLFHAFGEITIGDKKKQRV